MSGRHLTAHLRTFSAGIFFSALLIHGWERGDHSRTFSASPEVYFSPKGGVAERLLKSMNLCKMSYDVAVFDITSGPLTQGLIELHKRGKKVRVVSDFRRARENEHSTVRRLRDAGIDVRVTKGRSNGFMHHKFAVVDGNLVFTGSYNWSRNAEENNFENVVVLEGAEWSTHFQRAFDQVWSKGLPIPEPRPFTEISADAMWGKEDL